MSMFYYKFGLLILPAKGINIRNVNATKLPFAIIPIPIFVNLLIL